MHNHVIGTTERGILLGEMSMDTASHNEVDERERDRHHLHGPLDVRDRAQHGHRREGRRRRRTRPARGVAIEAYFFAEAKVHHNTVVASPGGVQAFDNSTINAQPAADAAELRARRPHGPPELPRPAVGHAARGMDVAAAGQSDPRDQPPCRAVRRLRRRALRAEGAARAPGAARVDAAAPARGAGPAGGRGRRDRHRPRRTTSTRS